MLSLSLRDARIEGVGSTEASCHHLKKWQIKEKRTTVISEESGWTKDADIECM